MIIDKNFKKKMLNWADQFNIFCLLDNNNYNFEEPAFECLLAVGCVKWHSVSSASQKSAFSKSYNHNPTWLFGHFGYNAFNNAYQKKTIVSGFAKSFLFEPETILQIKNNEVRVIKSAKPTQQILNEIELFEGKENLFSSNKIFPIPQISKEEYLEKIKKIQQHIARGDCYEINFCKKFEAKNVQISPIDTYLKLTTFSPAPFGALYKIENNYCICSSPERFLEKNNNTLISQPIKGTSRRDANIEKDNHNKLHLTQSQKEKSENVMIVDLVRNDLSMVCKKGSVHVKELFGVYSFPQVHQMISTIQGEVDANADVIKIIESCFPMGSMTGAPKPKVMQLIGQYEEMDRGLFSGSIGYFTPEKNFDFNVVIRSIFYNTAKSEVSFFAGSGITFYSDAEKEYDECLSKAEAMIKVLQ